MGFIHRPGILTNYKTTTFRKQDLFPSSGGFRLEFKILGSTAFRKLDLFPSSGEEMETPTLMGPLERAKLNHWNTLLGPLERGSFIRKSFIN
jgi:hypothetical protein